jgi:DNA helicase II / ATP-dependent DNA helicase PcrA
MTQAELPSGRADVSAVFEDLNNEQRRAVEQVRGPVVILAGAGSGKTTTITRRIAHQVLSGAFLPHELLAVTFTTKAAQELRDRLERLGVHGVPASTFHSAAQRQIGHFANERRQVISNKLGVLFPIARRLPPPHRNCAAADLASEIEYAKNRRLRPETYLDELGAHVPPIPPELMQSVFDQYEREKSKAERIDHEDQLELAVRVFEQSETAREEFRSRYQAFTVDEFQDVNLLHWSLLQLWLGERDELCAVGDDYQSIYGFTGATPTYLLSLPDHFPATKVVRLEQNYRSTPEILEFANRLVPLLGGTPKLLRTDKASGARPSVESFTDHAQEAASIAERCRELRAAVPLKEIAVLYRVNFRSPLFEEALTVAGIPFVVHGKSLLERPAAKQLLPRLRRRVDEPAAKVVTEEAVNAGYLTAPPRGIGATELARQSDLGVLDQLASAMDGSVAEFIVSLEQRFGGDRDRDGVQLMTYHSAKGLEFEVVFLPRLEERELPWYRNLDDGLDEERRLFYVGITRAKRILNLSWTREGQRSSFLPVGAPLKSSEPRRQEGRKAPVQKSPVARPRRRRGSSSGSSSTSSGLSSNSWTPEWMRDRQTDS